MRKERGVEFLTLQSLEAFYLRFNYRSVQGVYAIAVICYLFFSASAIHSNTVSVAVAANFRDPMQDIAALFQTKNPKTEVTPVYGSSGHLSNQIKHGAPYDIFLSADMDYPQRLYEEGFSIQRPRAYAKGKLIAIAKREILTEGTVGSGTIASGSIGSSLSLEREKGSSFSRILSIDELKSILLRPKVKFVAIANPRTAPYGRASIEVLKSSGLEVQIKHKFVYGESVSQVNQLIFSHSADIAFTSMSTIYSESFKKDFLKGEISKQNFSWGEIDGALYQPLLQGYIVLKRDRSKNELAVKEFIKFLFSKESQNILRKYGYELPE